MKLQAASKKEIRRIAIGTALGAVVMIAVMFLLSYGLNIGTFDYRVFVGALGGTLVAVLNFTIMCMTIERAVAMAEQKQMKAFIQGSYNGRLLLQAVWVVIAFSVKQINGLSAAIPLLFPNLMIMFLQAKGKLTTPSDRKASAEKEQNEETEEAEERLGSFEI